MTLALLITAAAGAWADSFSTEAYTADETLSAVSVTGDQTLTINEGVTVTVNNGLTINSGATLTVTGGGTLVVNGKDGANGQDKHESVDPDTGDEVMVGATSGVDGDSGIVIDNGGKLIISNATIIAVGGKGGRGGNNGDNNYAASGNDASGFASFPAIEGVTLSYSTNGTDYTKYESGNTTLYKYMKVETTGPEVTINDAKSEASFKMPQYDVTATYTLKRDMTVDVNTEIASRIRIKKDGNNYQPVGANGETDASAALPTVTDALDDANTSMTKDTHYTLTLQKQGETEDSWTDVTAYSVGTFRYKVTGTGNYSGEIITETFKLYEGYEVEVPAGEYVTYYKDEALKVEDADAKLYTITAVSGTTATASELDIAPAGTPILVKNNAAATKTFLLIPTETTNTVTVANEFKGSTAATTIAASTTTQNNYAFNGKEFVWVKNALDIPANKAWLQISNAESRTVKLVFRNSLTGIEGIAADKAEADGDGNWYDLNGRKLNSKPTTKGVYINNGRKVVIK